MEVQPLQELANGLKLKIGKSLMNGDPGLQMGNYLDTEKIMGILHLLLSMEQVIWQVSGREDKYNSL